MNTTADIRSFHVIIDAPAPVVFAFIRNVENLAQWSVHFAKGGVQLDRDGGAYVESPAGRVYFTITGDEATGVIDWWSGPSKTILKRWPTRVVALSEGRTLYQVTALLSSDEAGMPNLEQIFDDELGAIKRIVEEQGVIA
ncbi:MAG TPA: hypothetical protein VJ717_18005 [Gemmatimonadaceae bacterium]|nr:hypothetical protein [Gemmatimonadaceae bacterium]